MGRILGAAIAAVAASALMLAPSASAQGANCQPFLDDQPCLQPFPNDLYTKKANTPTGRRLDLPAAAMPVNTEGAPIDPAEWNRNDGFSPGSMITVHVPGLDTPQALANTNPAPLADMSQAFRKRAPVVVIDQKNGKRHLIWAELDSNATTPEATNLLIHPGVNFKEGHRYIVALRNLKDANGNTIPAPEWFARLRDGGSLPPEMRSQRKRYEAIFRELADAKVKRNDSLYAAWNFTVASEESLTSRMLHIRDDAFAQLGDRKLANGKVQGAPPGFEVTGIEEFTPQEDPEMMRRITGTFTVPCYLDQPGCPPGSRFNYASPKPDALPAQTPGNVAQADFMCIVPHAAQSAPARISLYGHGLLGSLDEVDAGNIQSMAAEHDFVFCATNAWGLSEGDIPYDITALQDLNRFPAAVDRLQQGALNTQFLGRLLAHPQGFASHPAFQSNGNSMLDTSALYYDSNSQGGILGGLATAVAPDFRRAVLGVPGQNYAGMLLQRSSDFPPFAIFLFAQAPGGGYADDSLHPLILSLMQQLWDRGEANGYAAHMTTDPLPDTPKHKVLMHVAYGDHQVSHYAAAVGARTIGASAYQPALDLPARQQDVNLLFGIPRIKKFPFKGSAIVIWDSGPGVVPPPPLTNTAPEGGEDPHGDPRATVAARAQKAAFLAPNGRVVDVCGGAPCHTDAFLP
jgi:hypothetical protein